MSRDLRGDGRGSRGSSVSGLSGAASSCGGSTGTGGASEPLINLDELSDEQILTLVNETAIAVEKLHMETVMFEKFYEKLGGGETVMTSRERTESGAREDSLNFKTKIIWNWIIETFPHGIVKTYYLLIPIPKFSRMEIY